MTRNTYSMLEDRIRILEQKINNYEKLTNVLISQIEFVQKVMPSTPVFKQEVIQDFAPPSQPPPEYNEETSNYDDNNNIINNNISPKVLPPKKNFRRVT